MATATFYTAAKRHNSTAIPTGGVAIDVVLKDGSDLLTPTFKMQYSGVPTWSMMQFEGRYYFITGITSLRLDLWEITASVDVLATYKALILASSAYVLYDTDANSEIVDDRLAVKTTRTIAKNTAQVPGLNAAGRVVVNIVGRSGSSGSFVIPWGNLPAIGNNAYDFIDDFMDFAYASDSWEDYIKGIPEMIKRGVVQLISSGNVLDAIRAVSWLPWEIEGTTVHRLYLGQYDSGLGGDRIDQIIAKHECNVAIPWAFSDWRRNSPYTEILLYLPFVGVINLSPSDLIGAESIHVAYSLNQLSGAVSVQVDIGDNVLGLFGAQTGITIPFGSSNYTKENIATSLIAGAGAAAAAGSSGGLIGAAAAGIGAGLSNLRQSMTSVGGGGGGGAARLLNHVQCTVISHDTAVPPGSVSPAIGTPAFAYKSLATLTGYVQTYQASIAGSMTDTERTLINNMLDGGIYIE